MIGGRLYIIGYSSIALPGIFITEPSKTDSGERITHWMPSPSIPIFGSDVMYQADLVPDAAQE